MIQETKLVKTWERFNLTILKVNLNLLQKNQSFTIATQTTNILLLPTSRNLLTRPRASSKTMDFFLGFCIKYKHTHLCIFKLLWQQLNNHQALEEISCLIILSLCKGKHLSDLTRDLHKQQYEPPKNVVGVCLIYLGQNIKP